MRMINCGCGGVVANSDRHASAVGVSDDKDVTLRRNNSETNARAEISKAAAKSRRQTNWKDLG